MENKDNLNITIYDISKEANVSPATVSRVLTGKANVSEKKRAVIMKIIEKYDYKPNALARSLISSQSHTIGFIVPDITNAYYASVYIEVESLAFDKGYSVLMGNSKGDYDHESSLLQVFLEKRVDAIVFMGGRVDTYMCDSKYHQELNEINKSIPILSTSIHNNISVTEIYPDESAAIHDLLFHLKSQECRTIGFLGGSQSVIVSTFRKQKVLQFAKELGIETRPEWIYMEDGFSIKSGLEAAEKLYEQMETPDAIFCVNDQVAVGALQYLGKIGVSVPGDVMLTGFEGTYLSNAVYPTITTAQFNYSDYASSIINILEKLINKEPCESSMSIRPRVVVRASTRRSILNNSYRE